MKDQGYKYIGWWMVVSELNQNIPRILKTFSRFKYGTFFRILVELWNVMSIICRNIWGAFQKINMFLGSLCIRSDSLSGRNIYFPRPSCSYVEVFAPMWCQNVLFQSQQLLVFCSNDYYTIFISPIFNSTSFKTGAGSKIPISILGQNSFWSYLWFVISIISHVCFQKSLSIYFWIPINIIRRPVWYDLFLSILVSHILSNR